LAVAALPLKKWPKLALPEKDRAYLARQLIGSLNDTVDADAETQWRCGTFCGADMFGQFR